MNAVAKGTGTVLKQNKLVDSFPPFLSPCFVKRQRIKPAEDVTLHRGAAACCISSFGDSH